VLVLGLVIAYPAVQAVNLGFYHYRLTDLIDTRWVGAANYSALPSDPVFWAAVKNTIVFTGTSVLLAALVGAVLALILDRLSERLPMVQTILLAPWAVPVVVIAFLFRYMFEQQGGIVNAALLATHLTATPVPWLSSGALAMTALIVASVWQLIPFFLLLLLAALKAVPETIIEAARVDGAGEWVLARDVKIPQLAGALVPAVLIAVIQGFNNLALPWSFTEGGPSFDTTTLVVFVFRLAFTEFNIGYAAAVGTIWLLLLVVFAVGFVRLTRPAVS